MTLIRSARTVPRCAAVLLTLSAGLVALSCSEDTNRTTTGPEIGTVDSGTFGLEGGTLVAAAPGGSVARLEIPDGAVDDVVTLILSADSPEEGQLARFRLEPAALSFVRPVMLRLSLPSEEIGASWSVFLYTGADSILTRSTPTDDGLEVELWNTGYDGTHGRMARAALAATDPTSTEIVVTTTECNRQLGLLVSAASDLQSWMTAESPDTDTMVARAHALLGGIAEFYERCGAEADTASLLGMLGETLCAHYTTVLATASVDFTGVPFTEMADHFLGHLAPVLAVAGNAQAMGQDCWEPGDIVEPFERFTDAFTQSVADHGVVIDHPFWRLLFYYLTRADLKLTAYAQQMGLSDELAPMIARLDAALYDAYWPIARETCREWNEQYQLVDLLTGGRYSNRPVITPVDSILVGASMSRQDILDAIQYGGSDVTMQVYEPGMVHSTHTLGEGSPAGSITSAVSVTTPEQAMLGFTGMLRPLRCSPPDGTAYTSEDDLVFRVDSTEVHRIPMPASGNFFSSPVDLPVSRLLEASPDSQSVTLTVERVGPMCDGWHVGRPGLRDNSVRLFEIQVNTEAGGGGDDGGGDDGGGDDGEGNPSGVRSHGAGALMRVGAVVDPPLVEDEDEHHGGCGGYACQFAKEIGVEVSGAGRTASAHSSLSWSFEGGSEEGLFEAWTGSWEMSARIDQREDLVYYDWAYADGHVELEFNVEKNPVELVFELAGSHPFLHFHLVDHWGDRIIFSEQDAPPYVVRLEPRHTYDLWIAPYVAANTGHGPNDLFSDSSEVSWTAAFSIAKE